jgi:hypothetical protein
MRVNDGASDNTRNDKTVRDAQVPPREHNTDRAEERSGNEDQFIRRACRRMSCMTTRTRRHDIV